MAEDVREKNDLPSTWDHVSLEAPSVHVLPYVTGGFRQLLRDIRQGNVPELPDFGCYTDEKGHFNPKGPCLLGMRYRVCQVLSNKGQTAVLVLAEDQFADSREVVIKVLHAKFYQHGAQESETLWRLSLADPYNYSQTLRLQNTLTYDYHFCMVFEPLIPEPLTQLFQQIPRHRLMPSIRKVFLRLLSSVGFLHQQNIIHTDIKPENILLKHEHDLDSVHLVDFGNAVNYVHREVSLYYNDFELQTPLYRAPEVMFGLPFGTEIDMWSLGCTLVELYKGQPLFLGLSRDQIVAQMHQILGPLPTKIFRRGKYFEEFKAYTSDCEQKEASLVLRDHLNCTDLQFTNLLAGLLQYDPAARLTAPEAARHPFFASHFPLAFLLTPESGKTAGYPTAPVPDSVYRHQPSISPSTRKKQPSSLELLRMGSGSPGPQRVERPKPRLGTTIKDLSVLSDRPALPVTNLGSSGAIGTVDHAGDVGDGSNGTEDVSDNVRKKMASLMKAIQEEQDFVERDLDRKTKQGGGRSFHTSVERRTGLTGRGQEREAAAVKERGQEQETVTDIYTGRDLSADEKKVGLKAETFTDYHASMNADIIRPVPHNVVKSRNLIKNRGSISTTSSLESRRKCDLKLTVKGSGEFELVSKANDQFEKDKGGENCERQKRLKIVKDENNFDNNIVSQQKKGLKHNVLRKEISPQGLNRGQLPRRCDNKKSPHSCANVQSSEKLNSSQSPGAVSSGQTPSRLSDAQLSHRQSVRQSPQRKGSQQYPHQSIRQSPRKQGGQLSPNRRGVRQSPRRQGSQLSPHRHGIRQSPRKQGGQLSPNRRGVRQSPRRQSSQLSPQSHSLRQSPHRQSGHLSPQRQGIRQSPRKQGSQRSPLIQSTQLSSQRQSGLLSPHRPGIRQSPRKHGSRQSPFRHDSQLTVPRSDSVQSPRRETTCSKRRVVETEHVQSGVQQRGGQSSVHTSLESRRSMPVDQPDEVEVGSNVSSHSLPKLTLGVSSNASRFRDDWDSENDDIEILSPLVYRKPAPKARADNSADKGRSGQNDARRQFAVKRKQAVSRRAVGRQEDSQSRPSAVNTKPLVAVATKQEKSYSHPVEKYLDGNRTEKESVRSQDAVRLPARSPVQSNYESPEMSSETGDLGTSRSLSMNDTASQSGDEDNESDFIDEIDDDDEEINFLSPFVDRTRPSGTQGKRQAGNAVVEGQTSAQAVLPDTVKRPSLPSASIQKAQQTLSKHYPARKSTLADTSVDCLSPQEQANRDTITRQYKEMQKIGRAGETSQFSRGSKTGFENINGNKNHMQNIKANSASKITKNSSCVKMNVKTLTKPNSKHPSPWLGPTFSSSNIDEDINCLSPMTFRRKSMENVQKTNSMSLDRGDLHKASARGNRKAVSATSRNSADQIYLNERGVTNTDVASTMKRTTRERNENPQRDNKFLLRQSEMGGRKRKQDQLDAERPTKGMKMTSGVIETSQNNRAKSHADPYLFTGTPGLAKLTHSAGDLEVRIQDKAKKLKKKARKSLFSEDFPDSSRAQISGSLQDQTDIIETDSLCLSSDRGGYGSSLVYDHPEQSTSRSRDMVMSRPNENYRRRSMPADSTFIVE